MALEIGQPAPGFTLSNQHGQSISLADFADEQHVVVAFYPFAFSGVCTGELRQLRDSVVDFSEAGTSVLAISCDAMYTLRAFADQEDLQFSLLSDHWPHGAVAQSYGVFNDDRGCAVRGTFIVDRDGILRWRVKNEIPQARNLDDYRKVLASLD